MMEVFRDPLRILGRSTSSKVGFSSKTDQCKEELLKYFADLPKYADNIEEYENLLFIMELKRTIH